ncbi:MAG: enoyl-CoA hydratase/isomerase family protein [Myxococcales bacterium]|nr:enoyl-CoA hydratase/isomerase family protein [Myxococcales bacterium]
MSEGPVLLTKQGALAKITLSRPERRNALDRATWEAIGEAVRAVDVDPEIRVGIFTGAGDSTFCSGLDLTASSLTGTQGEATVSLAAAQRRSLHEVIRPFQAIFSAVAGCRVPLIGAINGHAIGAGFELMLCLDVRIASEEATFSIPEVKYGLAPDMGGTQRLRRIIGLGATKELIFTGRRIDAREAHRLGLVDHVVPRAEVIKRAEALAGEIAENAPLAVQAAKRAIDASMDLGVRDGLEVEAALAATCLPSLDAYEAFAALKEKRSPRFRGE